MIVKLDKITKKYENSGSKISVLSNMSLSVKKGDIITIFGHSGVGKSTLLNIINGTLNVDSGSVLINGDLLTDANSHLIRKKIISSLFQKDNLLPELNVRDNLLLPLIINDLDYSESLSRVSEVLNFLEMKKFEYRYPNQISRGEYQRISLLRCMVNNPELIIADEPTANLDENSCEQLLNLIVKLNEELGITFIIATHDKRFMKTCNKTYEIFNGDLILK
tara:strand:+ start:1970 stop:2632 length:663 start_codon:yes stop_codon:yes gene_type:complete